MKIETVEEYIKRGGHINYVPKVEVSPGKEDTKLKTKLIAMNWPKSMVEKAVVRRGGSK